MSRSWIFALVLVYLVIGIGVGFIFSHGTISDLRSKIRSLESEKFHLQTGVNGLQEEIDDLSSDYDDLRSNYDNCVRICNQLLDDYAELNETYQMLKKGGLEVHTLLDEGYYHSVKNDLETASESILVAMYSMIQTIQLIGLMI